MEKKPLKLLHGKHNNLNITFNQAGNLHISFDIKDPVGHDGHYIDKELAGALNSITSYMQINHDMVRRNIALADMQRVIEISEDLIIKQGILTEAERGGWVNAALANRPKWYQKDISDILDGVQELKKACKTGAEYEAMVREQLGDTFVDYIKTLPSENN